MTRVGTGFIEIKPDWSGFGKDFDREAQARIAALGAAMQGVARKQLSTVSVKAKAVFDNSSINRIRTDVQKTLKDIKVPIVAQIPADVGQKLRNVALSATKNVPSDLVAGFRRAGLEGTRAIQGDITAGIERLRPRLKLDIDRDSIALTASVLVDLLASAGRRGARGIENGLRGVSARASSIFSPISAGFSKAVGAARGLETGIRNTASRAKSALSPITDGFSSVVGTLAGGLTKIVAPISGLLGSIPVVGGAFRGLTSAFGTTALGAAGASVAVVGLGLALAAIGASAGAAAAGVGALGVALAAALGPVALVGLVALARLAVIVKDVAQAQTKAPQAAAAAKSANQQVAQSNMALGQAYKNLKEQTDAARQAQVDATEAVKDDRLARAQAAEGIVGARLSTRQAIKDLQDFRKQAGAAGEAVGGVFKKFTDVNVDTGGLRKALTAATSGAGAGLTGDQELELEQKIHAVREAKLAERAATDQLHDSTVQLGRDRKKEGDFATQGLKAYGPYAAALDQVHQAQLGLAQAQEKQTAAAEATTGKFAGLTVAEQRFADKLRAIGKSIRTAFGPATDAIFRGAGAALDSFTGLLKDPAIRSALTAIGQAIGGTIASLGKALSSSGARDAFVTFAKVGAVIAGVFGRKVFKDFGLIIQRIAIAALPSLVRAIAGIVALFDRFEQGTRNGDHLRATIDKLTNATFLWVGFLSKAITAVVKIGIVLAPIGNAIIAAFTNPSAALRSFARSIGLSKTEISALGRAIRTVASVIRTVLVIAVRIAAVGVRNALGSIARIFTDVVTAISAIARGDWSAAWHAVRKIPVDIIHGIESFLRGLAPVFADAGRTVGHAFSGGIKGAMKGIVGFFKGTLDLVIDAINEAIKAINKVTPGPIKVLGKAITPGIPDIPEIPHLAKGGVIPGHGGTDSQLIAATPGEFMINPLGRRAAGDAMLHDLNQGRRPGGGVTQNLTQYIAADNAELVAAKAARAAKRELDADLVLSL